MQNNLGTYLYKYKKYFRPKPKCNDFFNTQFIVEWETPATQSTLP